MRRKLPESSTGHGTGVLYVRGLHAVLGSERIRKYEKKRARVERLGERLKRWSKLSPRSSFVLGQRLQTLTARVSEATVVLARLHKAAVR